jgi:acetyltransferase-like isoleucine patch superfamily enzyme
MYRKIKTYYSVKKYNKLWRKLNRKNFTSPTMIYPKGLISVGDYSYGPINAYFYHNPDEKLIIGKFVCLAKGVTFILGGEHNYHYLTNYPFSKMLLTKQNEATTKGPIIIKDDVWLGVNALILSGVTIAQGSVIAAGSVVVKNTEPYGIYGGNPAKLIKYRFSESIINKLLKINYSSMDITVDNKLFSINEEITDENIDQILLKLQ